MLTLNKVKIKLTDLFYCETRRREVVHINEQLRELTYECARKMHDAWNKRHIPKGNKKPRCKKCSLVDMCLPELEQRSKVSDYLKRNLYEETS